MKKSDPQPRAWSRLSKEDEVEREACKAKFRTAGVAVDAHHDPFYVDVRRTDKSITIDSLPELRDACLSMQASAKLFICKVSHFATQVVGFWVAKTLARKRAILVDLETGTEWDFENDPGAGYELAERVVVGVNKAKTRKARETRAAMGKTKRAHKLRGKKRDEAAARWVDTDLSGSEAAALSGVSRATMEREFGGRLEAINKAQSKKRS